MIRRLIFYMFILISATACSQHRTYLMESERSWSPYIAGQKLVFHSSNQRYDTLEIKKVIGSSFPDGIGSKENERLRVTAIHKVDNSNRLHELSFLYIYASWRGEPSGIDFEFFLPGRSFWGRGYPINELEGCREISINTPYGSFQDVITILDNSNRPYNKSDIKVIFWSKSRGYISFEHYDGTLGKLVDIIE